MRFSAFLSFVLFSMSSLLLTACDPSGTPEPETAIEYGFPSNEAFDCSNVSILDALVKVCNYFADCSMSQACNRTKQELFTGVTLQSTAKPASTYWNGFGGRGEVIADASLCMLKELSKGSVVNTATAKLFEVFPVKVKQTLGFLHFDPAARSVDAYQTVSVCLPLVGCFDAKEQAIQAMIKQRSPAHPEGKSCGNFPVEDSVALQVTAEESSQSLTAKVQEIQVSTPYGPIYIRPGFNYSSDLHAVMFPLSETFNQYYSDRNTIHLFDTYGRIPGVNVSVEPRQATPSGVPYDTGWLSQIGLGSRQPDADSLQWTRNPDAPVRPDLDLSLARNDLERQPVARFEALAEIRYPVPLPAQLNESPLKTTLQVWATPKVTARYASQLDIFFNEFVNSYRDVGPELRISGVQMESRADANASFSIDAGIDLVIDWTAFVTKNLVNAHPKTHFVIASNNDQEQKAVGVASSTSDPRDGAEPRLDTFNTLAAGAQRTPVDYVKQCVANPVADQPKPVATFTPGNGDILTHTEYPCNICVGHESHTEGNISINAFSTVLTPAGAGPTAWNCNEYHAGCFDMCTFDPATNALTVHKTALQMGLRGMPRNLACNELPPR